jgi:GNAT superfamily N-acetyltransferase
VRDAIEVVPVRGDRDRESFIRLPWRIYDGDPHWVPPLLRDERVFLDPVKNPFFEHGAVELFLARREGAFVGRIAAIRNDAHNALHEDRVGFFGLFECTNEPAVAGALFDAAARWLGHLGLDTMRGPMSFSTNDTCGLLVEGFDGPPFILMPYNPSYYEKLLLEHGFLAAKDLLAYLLPVPGIDFERIARVERLLDRRRARGEAIVVRNLDKRRWNDEVATLHGLYNRAWEKNWGFVPFSDHEFRHLAAHMKQVIDPELVGIVEVNGTPVGFGLALPDMNLAIRAANGRLFPIGIFKVLWAARRIRRVRVPILGLIPEHRGKGYDMALYGHLSLTARRKGIECGETSWILEDNLAMCHAMEQLGAYVHRRYRVFDRPLRPALAS